MGFQETLPGCGIGCIFRRYLKPVSTCDYCDAALGAIRTDDCLFTLALWIILLFATALSVILVLLLPHARVSALA